jgi:hypothetical protein
MAILTKGKASAAFIISQANGYQNSDDVTVTVPADTTYAGGTILGKITATGKFVRHAAGAGDGSENEAGVLYETLTNTTGSGVDNASTLFIRLSEVAESELTYEVGADGAQVTASNLALKALGIIVR